MRRYIEKNVEDFIAEKMIAEYPKKLLGVHLDVDGGKITIKTL